MSRAGLRSVRRLVRGTNAAPRQRNGPVGHAMLWPGLFVGVAGAFSLRTHAPPRLFMSTTSGGGSGGGALGDRSTARVSAAARYRRPTTVLPEPRRLVVVGDVHGDINAFRSCLQMARLTDPMSDRWSSDEGTVLVQIGDVFDRGDDDLAIEEWLYTLGEEAKAAGSAVYSLLGNHEMLNVMGDHTMATRKAFAPFLELEPHINPAVLAAGGPMEQFPAWAKARIAAMVPGGPVSRLIAGHSVCMKVGDSLLVHAGLLPSHFGAAGAHGDDEEDEESSEGDRAAYPAIGDGGTGGSGGGVSGEAAIAVLEKYNRRAFEWLVGAGEVPRDLWGGESPVWTRAYSSPDSVDVTVAARSQLEDVLRRTGCSRMIVGHTPQRLGINSAADGQVWRVDTGMTAMIGGRPEALEILPGGAITVLTETREIPGEKRRCRPRGKPATVGAGAADAAEAAAP